MKADAKPVLGDTETLKLLPRWVTPVRGEAIETVAFSSGAALALLNMVLRDLGGTLPGALLLDRMALDAAVACLKLEGRNETASGRGTLYLCDDAEVPCGVWDGKPEGFARSGTTGGSRVGGITS